MVAVTPDNGLRNLFGAAFDLVIMASDQKNVLAKKGSILYHSPFVKLTVVVKFNISIQKRPVFLHACASCSETPYNIGTMGFPSM